MPIQVTKQFKALLLLFIAFNISACGFQLRGSQALPDHITQAVIKAPMQHAPLSRALQKRLPVYQLQGIINSQHRVSPEMLQQTVTISLQPEQFERRLLSVFTSGQVAEYDLVYTVNYTVTFPNSLPIENTLTVSREYQDDPDQILAKSRELNLVLAELRTESADRIIRLLSSQFSLAELENSNAQHSSHQGN